MTQTQTTREPRPTSRAMNLSITESAAQSHCDNHGIGISALEPLPAGGVRLVCMSVTDAVTVRRQLKSKLISMDAKRTAIRPSRPLW